jgi:hypothetical protein
MRSSFSFCVPGPFRAIAFSRRNEGVSAQMQVLRASSFKVKRISDMPVAPACTIESPWGRQSNQRSCNAQLLFFCVPGPFRAIAFSRRNEGVSAQMQVLRASSFKVKRISAMPVAPACTIEPPGNANQIKGAAVCSSFSLSRLRLRGPIAC